MSLDDKSGNGWYEYESMEESYCVPRFSRSFIPYMRLNENDMLWKLPLLFAFWIR